MNEEIKDRLASTYKHITIVYRICLNWNIYHKNKKNLYTRYLSPFLTYGCETRATSKENLHSLIVFERKISWKIYGLINIYSLETKRYEKNITLKYRGFKEGHLWKADGQIINSYWWQWCVTKDPKTYLYYYKYTKCKDFITKDIVKHQKGA